MSFHKTASTKTSYDTTEFPKKPDFHFINGLAEAPIPGPRPEEEGPLSLVWGKLGKELSAGDPGEDIAVNSRARKWSGTSGEGQTKGMAASQSLMGDAEAENGGAPDRSVTP